MEENTNEEVKVEEVASEGSPEVVETELEIVENKEVETPEVTEAPVEASLETEEPKTE